MLHLVIMAGGSGTRFWPESRRARPKQFLTLAGERSLLQQAADRCRGWIPSERIWVVTGALHADETRRQLPEVPGDHVLVEPCGRNTAPCIALAAAQVRRADADATVLVTPADHLIRPDREFRATVERAQALLAAHPRSSVLFGIPPTYPATGYGYIERGAPVPGIEAFRVASFREKPDAEVAKTFLDSGRYYWNAGIFVWRAEYILDLIEKLQPDIYARLRPIVAALGTSRAQAVLEGEFPSMPSISIDYGVLEPAGARQSADEGVFVVPVTFEWDDVGSWQALPRVLGQDVQGNTLNGTVCTLDTEGCIVRTTPGHLVATIGLSNLVVVHTPDATLIAPKDDETALRKLVALLEKQGHERFL